MRIPFDDIVNRDGLSRVPGLLRIAPTDLPHQRMGKRLLVALLIVAAIGAAAMAVSFTQGHHVMGTTSEVSWGVLIATYVYFVAFTTGLCLVSSLGHVFGYKVFEPIAKKAIFLAFVTLLVGFSVIASELEAPFKLLKYAILSPNPTAPIWWMGTLYGLYLVVLGVELYLLLVSNHRWAKVAGAVGVFASIAAHSNLGAVFGLAHSRPFWYGPLLPVYLTALALVSGAALLVVMVTVTDYFTTGSLKEENAPLLEALRKLLALFILIFAFISIWRWLSGMAGGHRGTAEAMGAALTGPLFVSFWLGEVLLGMVVPLVLLLGPWHRSWRAISLAGFLPVISIFVMRFNFVLQGQMVSLKPLVGASGERYSYMPPFKGTAEGFLPYTPSLAEALVVAGAISAAILIYVAGLKALRLVEKKEA